MAKKKHLNPDLDNIDTKGLKIMKRASKRGYYTKEDINYIDPTFFKRQKMP